MRKNHFPLLVIGLSIVSGAAHGAVPSAAAQIEQAASKAAQAEIRTMARGQGWGKYGVQPETVLPPEAAALPQCPKTPVATPTPGSKRMLYRLRYDIICPGEQGWALTVALKTAVNLPVVVAMHTLERGRVIDSQDVVLKVQDIAPLNGLFLTNPQDATGQTVKRRINASQIVTPALLEQPVMVERGQNVLITARLEGIEASTSGEAMKQGRKGEVIRVRNTSSQRIVDAVVVSPGVVRIIAPAR